MTSLAIGPAVDPVAVGRELVERALAGADWRELVDLLARRCVTACRLVAPDGTLLAASDGGSGLTPAAAHRLRHSGGGSVGARDGWAARGLPARAGGHLHAFLLIAEDAPPHVLEVAEAAVTAVLIEAVRRQAALPQRGAGGAAVIAALRAGEAALPALSAASANRQDGQRRSQCGAVLRYTGRHTRTWATALSWLERPVQQQGRDAYCLVTGAPDLSRVRRHLQVSVGDATVLAACGPEAAEPGAFRESFQLAEALLAQAPEGGELAFTDAGLLQVLLAVPRDRLEFFVRRHLGPVLDRPELLATLERWLATSGSRQAVSEQLHLHRNSVGYRVGQLKGLLGVDPLEPAAGAILHAALCARRVLSPESPLLAGDCADLTAGIDRIGGEP